MTDRHIRTLMAFPPRASTNVYSAGGAFVEACVGAGLRRHDVVLGMRGLLPFDVIPTKVGIYASLRARAVRNGTKAGRA
jgi:hypothetical protein